MITLTIPLSLLALLALLAVQASAHGAVSSPLARVPGPAYKTACGEQVYNNQASDPYGNIQQLAKIGAGQKDFSPSTCNLALCKGFQLADSPASAVQKFTPGQTVPFQVHIQAPHTGTANVSVVNLQKNAIMGDMLMVWDVYASTSRGVQKNETDFSVTIPTNLPQGSCAQPGQCAVQWWWDSREVDQTYMSCVDFTM